MPTSAAGRASGTSVACSRDEYNPLIEAIRRVPKPVVASVNGVAAGAGVSLAFAADLVVAATEARFVPAFNRIALVPDSGLTRTLVRALGRHRALEVLLGERELNADQAHDAVSWPRSCRPTAWPR